MRTKRILVQILVGLLTIVFWSCATKDRTKPKTIGIISVIEHPALNAARDGFKDVLNDSGYMENKNVTYDYRNAKGSIENAHQIVAGFIGNKVDMILAIGTPVAKVAAEKTEDIPIMIAAITDPVGAGLVESMQHPGKNVSGTSDMNPVKEQFGLIKEMLPKAQRVGILYNPGESNSAALVKIARQVAKDLGIDLIEATANNTSGVQAAVASLVGKVDAVFMPTDNTMAAAIDVIQDICAKNKIPFFSSDEESVKQVKGAVASISVDYYKLGRQTGTMAARVLKGESPSSMPVEYQKDFNLSINLANAKILGIEVPQGILDRAKIFGQ